MSRKTNEIVRYYPTKKDFENTRLVKIDLKNTRINFKKITNLVNDIHRKDSTPYVEIIIKDTVNKIILLRNDFGFIRSKNRLEIREDSILIDKSYSIGDLNKILKRHYGNNGKNPRYPNTSEKAFVELSLDTVKNGIELTKSLSTLIKEFNKINYYHADSLRLKIALSYFHQIPPPPPPIDD